MLVCHINYIFLVVLKMQYDYRIKTKYSNSILILALDGNDQFSYINNRIEIRAPKSLDGQGEYRNSNITVALPSGIETSDIIWLSVWCDDFKISFGDLVFNSYDVRENSCPPAFD